jgi:hypothetical protein
MQTSTSKKTLSLDLPQYVTIPTISLHEKVCGIDANISNLYFETRNVPGDGNCLYCALSCSKNFVAKYPSLENDVSSMRKSLADCIQAEKNRKLVQYLLDTNPPPGVTNVDEWVRRVQTKSLWGSVAEVVMFTHLFQINVVVVLQLENGVSAWGTYQSFKKQLNHQLSKLVYDDKTMYHNTIFVWHHQLGDFNKIIKDSKEANHFTNLEMCNDDCVDRGRDIFAMRNFWRESNVSPRSNTFTILDTPPYKK